MRVLIGTPIHELKDYCMEKWLKNVAKVQKQYRADLLMIDNSKGTTYIEKVEGYCKKFGITNFALDHFEIESENVDVSQLRSMRVEYAQEMIRQATLKGGYDAWFSWECDQIIPSNSLKKLSEMMQLENYMMIVVNSWSRLIPNTFNANMGVTLISRQALQNARFLPEKNGEISRNIADGYDVDETMFKKRILKSGGNYIEIYGVIKPIYHLTK